MGLQITTAPDQEPVTLEDAKLHLRVDHDVEDVLITRYIRSARLWVEDYTHRKLITQTAELTLPDFPRRAIRLPFGKCSAVQSIKYFDSAGVQQTLTGPTSGSPSGTDYQEDFSSDEGAIVAPPVDDDWPAAQTDRLAPVTVQYDVGYGPDGADVPDSFITALLYRLTDLYEFRGSMDGSGTSTAKLELDGLRLVTV